MPIDDEKLLRLRHGTPEARAHLDGLAGADPEVALRLAEWDRQDAALRSLYDGVAAEPLPERLRAALTPPARRPRAASVAAAVAIFAVGAGAGWIGAQFPVQAPAREELAAEALRAHATFVVEALHPVEVPASDEAHLVAWLSKRVGARIKTPDLEAVGFRLMGGRIVPDVRGAAAMMMYEDDTGRRVTLYVSSAPEDGETAFRFVRGDDAQGFWWVDEGLGCALVGDLPRDLLRAIAVRAYEQLIET